MSRPTEAQRSEQSNQLKHLTEDEMIDVLECSRKLSSRDHCLLLMAYMHGLRNQEVARLQLQDIDLTRLMVNIKRQKGSLETEQPLVQHKGRPALDVVGTLKKWLAERNSATNLVFPSGKCSISRGRALSQQSVTRLFRKYCCMANAEREARGAARIDEKVQHFHAVKHTRGTVLAERGVNAFAIKMILGHKAMQSTEKYLHPSQKAAWREERRAMEG